MSGRVIRSVDGAGRRRASRTSRSRSTRPRTTTLAAKGSALISFETPQDEVQAFDVPLAKATVTITQSSTISYQGDPVTLSATVTGTSPFPGPPTGQVQFTVDGAPVGAPVALDGSGSATLVTTALPLGTHQVRARYLGDGDYAAGDSDPVSHLTVNLPELHNVINSFGLDPFLATTLNTAVSQAEKQAGLGPLHYPQVCEKLDDMQEAALDAAGSKGMGYDEARLLLDATNVVGAKYGCATAMPPTPQALHDVLTLMGTIAGMGLSADESTSLITKTRDVGKKLIDHQAYQACKKLGDLQQQINVDVAQGRQAHDAAGSDAHRRCLCDRRRARLLSRARSKLDGERAHGPSLPLGRGRRRGRWQARHRACRALCVVLVLALAAAGCGGSGDDRGHRRRRPRPRRRRSPRRSATSRPSSRRCCRARSTARSSRRAAPPARASSAATRSAAR